MTDRNKNRPGYKETKVGWIPEEWESLRLEKVAAKTQLGGNYNGSLHATGTPLIKMGNMERGRISLGKLERLEETDSYNKKDLLLEGDFLFNTRNSLNLVGKTSLWRCELREAVFNSNIMRIHFRQTCIASSAFACFSFNSPYALKQLFSFAIGTTSVAAIYWRDLKRFLLITPPLPEQEAIAEMLGCWDEGIETIEKLIEAKKLRKKGLMQRLLSGQPGFGAECRISNIEQGIPKGWKEVRLGDVFKERKETKHNDLPLLAITGNRGIIPADEVNKKDSSNADKSKYKRICLGDLGYNTMRMWQGVSAISPLEGIVSPAYTICIPSKKLDAKFIGYLFKTTPIIHRFWRHSQGLVDDTLNLKYPNFSKIKIRIPPLEEQKAIATVLEAADEEIGLLEAERDALCEQKKGLMQKLLTGEVRCPEYRTAC